MTKLKKKAKKKVRNGRKTITQGKLLALMLKAEGDWDFLIFLLNKHWGQNEA